jgi:hypothetical protein
MIRLDLNKELLTLEGVTIPELNMAKIVADRLFTSGEGDALKYLDWALTLQKEGVITIDSSDYDSLLSFLKTCKTIQAGYKGQILKAVIQARS